MKSISRLFRHKNCNIVGMLHVPALPGTPASTSSIKEIIERVEEETEIYLQSGVDGLILENMHDTPYCLARDLEPHITATMTVLASRVRNLVRDPAVPVGVQVFVDLVSCLMFVNEIGGELMFFFSESCLTLCQPCKIGHSDHLVN